MPVFLMLIAVFLMLAASPLSAAAPATAPATQPAGVLFTESFDDPNLNQRGWYDGSRYRIVADAAAGRGCIEYEWVAGNPNVAGSTPSRRLFEPTDTIYVRFYLKLSRGWRWTNRNFHPHLIYFLTTENTAFHGPAASHLTVYVEPVNGKLRLAAQDIQNRDRPGGLTQGPIRGGYNGRFYDSQLELFTDDRWHCVEASFQLNTLDPTTGRPNRDGIVRGWFDGEMVIDHADVILRSGDFPTMKFNQILIGPYFNPAVLPGPQKLWIDELSVAAQRLGPPPQQSPPQEDAAPGR